MLILLISFNKTTQNNTNIPPRNESEKQEENSVIYQKNKQTSEGKTESQDLSNHSGGLILDAIKTLSAIWRINSAASSIPGIRNT